MPTPKPKIPKEFKPLWKKDYYSLSSDERLAMQDWYIKHLAFVESSGGLVPKLDPPFFLTQVEILQKEEDVKLAAAPEPIQDPGPIEEKDYEEDSALKEWESKRIIHMDEVERLKLENFQLKLELIDKTIKEALQKKQSLLDGQVKHAESMEAKYGILMDDYSIDLLTGYMVRSQAAVFKK